MRITKKLLKLGKLGGFDLENRETMSFQKKLIAFVFLTIATLIIVEMNYPSFLSNYVYPLGVVTTSSLLTAIAYLQHSMQYKVDVNITITHKSEDSYKGLEKQKQMPESETGFRLIVQATNVGYRVVTLINLCNEKKDSIDFFLSPQHQFGYKMEEGALYSNVHNINRNSLDILKKASKVYAVDTGGRKYQVEKESLKRVKDYIKEKEG